MKIGIIEIMPKGHFTLVNSLIQIYCSDSNNEINVFTHKVGFEILQPMIKGLKNVFIICQGENEKLDDFIIQINKYELSKLYIVTLDSYFSKIHLINTEIPLFLFIHNTENWFLLSFKILVYRFFKSISKTKKIIYNFKVCFIYPLYKNMIKKQVIQSKGKYVVLNKILKKELSFYISEDKIEVIPFSIYDPKLKQNIKSDKILRVCIPGILDDYRRDYSSVFNCLEKDIDFFKDKLELILLGGIPNINNNKVVKDAGRLKKMGIHIKYYPFSFIPFAEYDDALANSDIILGNFYTVINKYSIYGKTKDTGMIFAMIRVAKPGILPKEYALIDELDSSTIKFESYNELGYIFKQLITNDNLLSSLTLEAKNNSKWFTPSFILKSL